MKQTSRCITKDINNWGWIPAGNPLETVADKQRSDLLQRLREPGLYQLEVRGDSMIEEGIYDGDMVLITPLRTALNGQVVVALIDGLEATLKRYCRKGNEIELSPANPLYQVQCYHPDRVEIQGVLHSVHRFY